MTFSPAFEACMAGEADLPNAGEARLSDVIDGEGRGDAP